MLILVIVIVLVVRKKDEEGDDASFSEAESDKTWEIDHFAEDGAPDAQYVNFANITHVQPSSITDVQQPAEDEEPAEDEDVSSSI